jgi:hypothetical protein
MEPLRERKVQIGRARLELGVALADRAAGAAVIVDRRL